MNPTYNDPHFKDRRRLLRKEQTEVEKKLWFHIRDRQAHGCKFFRQYGVGPYILDFYCPEVRLAIELDGGQHNEESNKEYDKLRTEFLGAGDIRVLRFWNNEVLMNLEGVLERIAEEVMRGVTPPSSSYSKRRSLI